MLAEYELFPREDEMTTNGGSTIAGNKYDGVLKSMGPGHFEGTCRMPDGRFDREKFKVQDQNLARRMWERWCEEVRQNKEPTQPRKPVSTNEEVQEETVELREIETVSESMVPSIEESKVYCIVAKGGTPFKFTTNMETALAAADILTEAMRAAGVDAIYDVVEVAKWEI